MSKELSIAEAVREFRREIKPVFNGKGEGEYIRFVGLREDDAKEFGDELVFVSR